MEQRKRQFRCSATTQANLRLLCKVMALTRAEQATLVLAAMLRHDESLAEVADRTYQQNNVVDQIREVIGFPLESVRQALAPGSMLTRSRLVDIRSGHSLHQNLSLRRGSFRSIVSSRLASVDALFVGVMALAPRPTLTRDDYPCLEPDFSVVLDILVEALRARRRGVAVAIRGRDCRTAASNVA